MVNSVFFFFGRENNHGRESPFLGSFWIFSRAKMDFHARIFRFFSLFSRPYFDFTGKFSVFFTGKKSVSRPKIREFSRAEFFFHGHFLSQPAFCFGEKTAAQRPRNNQGRPGKGAKRCELGCGVNRGVFGARIITKNMTVQRPRKNWSAKRHEKNPFRCAWGKIG